MDFNRLTIKSQQAIAAAQDDARRRGNPELTPDHLLPALLDQELFADWQGLRADAERKVAALPSVQGGQRLNGRTWLAIGTRITTGACEWYTRCAQPGRSARSWEAGSRGRQATPTGRSS